ncbi:hypothetical protein [Streptomyces sp. NRRL S-813]|uniref:hypothetical protein n=1 Tax=Streptomyces sp. NRRL S-813 TaxID=1463919 RepID=UPI0004C1DC8D|nr:hypothetical protein [Streptomyces sp. NRRL S-813]
MGDIAADNTAACRPEPLIFLRYDLGLALDNTAKAGANHRITITAHHQDRISAPPKVNVLMAEASYDGGRTWKRVNTRASGTNTFTAQIKNPGVKQAAQGVGLRIHAADTKGDNVSQTLPTAYKAALRAPLRTRTSRTERVHSWGEAEPAPRPFVFPRHCPCRKTKLLTARLTCNRPPGAPLFHAILRGAGRDCKFQAVPIGLSSTTTCPSDQLPSSVPFPPSVMAMDRAGSVTA